ncbi:hypothetical protein D3C77_631470 [compost metagenome]
MVGVAVRSQPRRQLETCLAAGDEVDHPSSQNGADHLGDHVGQQLFGREAPAHHQPERHGGVEVAAGDMADGEGHGQHGEAEGEGDTEYTDADGRTGCEYRTATAAKH